MPAKKPEVKIEKLEREYVIPLRRRYKYAVRYKKTPKAVKAVKEFLVKHMKIYDRDLKKIKIDKFLNEYLWFNGIKNPPHKVKVKVIKQGDIVNVELIDYPTKLKFKKAREEKQSKDSKEIVEKKKTLMQKVKEPKEAKPEDKDKDGVKDKTDEKEKIKAGEETANQQAKAQAKQMKQSTGGKTKEPKRPVRQALQK